MEKKIFIAMAVIAASLFFYGCKKKSETLKPSKVENMELTDIRYNFTYIQGKADAAIIVRSCFISR